MDWNRRWKVGERKAVPGYNGIQAYRGKKKLANGQPDMSFRYKVENSWVKVGKMSEGITLEDVVILRAEHIKRMRFGDTLPEYVSNKKPITLQEGFDRFMEHIAEVHPKSVSNYQSVWNQRIRSKFGSMPMDQIDHKSIQKWMASLHGKYAAGSINNIKLVMSGIFGFCRDSIDVPYDGGNPASLVERVRETPRDRFLTEEEITGFLHYVDQYGSRKAALQIRLMLGLGLRRSEVRGRGSSGTEEYGIRWDGIDWENNTITFRRKFGSMGTMPLPRHIKEKLIEYGPKPSGFVFDSFAAMPISKLISDYGLNSLDKTMGNKHKRVTPHTFRHTFCTWVDRKSGNAAATQHLMNHSDPTSTARYRHLIPDEQREALDTYSSFITPKKAQVIPFTGTK
jgi:integrase